MLFGLVSAHVAAPHRYQRYFPQEWLQHVHDNDCRSVLETRSEDGRKVDRVIDTQPLSVGFRHAALDVACFIIDENTIDPKVDGQILSLDMEKDERCVKDEIVGKEVVIAGYRLKGDSGSGVEAVIHTKMEGQVSRTSKSRGFINTGIITSEMGMCGGPIVLKGDSEKCIGLLEGLVPKLEEGEQAQNEMHKLVAGQSVFVSAQELGMFVQDVETEYTKQIECEKKS